MNILIENAETLEYLAGNGQLDKETRRRRLFPGNARRLYGGQKRTDWQVQYRPLFFRYGTIHQHGPRQRQGRQFGLVFCY